MLVLDEATSAMDTVTESAIQAALSRVRAGRTVLCIAHRLSTIKDAHEIIVIANGAIEERGTHEQLLANRGRYYTLWSQQAAAAANEALAAQEGSTAATATGSTGSTSGGAGATNTSPSVGATTPSFPLTDGFGTASATARAGPAVPVPVVGASGDHQHASDFGRETVGGGLSHVAVPVAASSATMQPSAAAQHQPEGVEVSSAPGTALPVPVPVMISAATRSQPRGTDANGTAATTEWTF